ncbi:MAG TPA: dienelactone hydrolase family protein [Euzebyales bacterium]|nr:dienelactone hydrolase family protein [Euzebyales bacterium]
MGAIIRLDERHARAYVAEPDDPARGRILVVHDAFGLLPHVRFLCDELAGAGFVALAPDLFAGIVTRSGAQASRLLEELTPDRAERLLAAALRGFDVVGHGSGPSAVIGFSIGAEFGFGLAARRAVQAIVSYYGMPTNGPEDAIVVPLLAHWAEHDEWDDDARPERFVADLLARGVDVTSHHYPGTSHGFANADIAVFDLYSAERAWHRTVDFLSDRLTAA